MRTRQYRVTRGALARCATCRKGVFVIRWTDDGYSVWSCLRHTRRAWKILEAASEEDSKT